MSEPQATPTVKRGQHKPDCKCGWCATKLRNLQKKTAASAGSAPAAVPDPVAKTSGESSAPSSPPKAAAQPAATPATKPATTMRAKVARMTATRAATTASHEPKPTPAKRATEPAATRKGWFEKLFSGPLTFFDEA